MFPFTSSPLDPNGTCVRELWSTFTPSILVVAYCIWNIPLPVPLKKLTVVLKFPFRTFLTPSEAEALDNTEGRVGEGDAPEEKASLWLTLFLSSTALSETAAWIAIAVYNLAGGGKASSWSASQAVIIAATWFYASIKPVLRTKSTPHYDLFALYVTHLIGEILVFGGALYDYNVSDKPLPSKYAIGLHILNVTVIASLLAITLLRPLAVPTPTVSTGEIGNSVAPEDCTTLWSWITFSWVTPLVRRGTYKTLNEDDVCELSKTMQARPLFLKFSELKRRSLLRKIWDANSLDIIVEFVLTVVSVFLSYARPYLLKRIIDAMDDSSPEQLTRAYIFACLMFLSQLLRAEADLQHLWFSRRASIRIQSELTSALYDKALKRKDVSGVVRKKKDERKVKQKVVTEEKTDDNTAGADIGKIVNLMSGDVNQIAFLMSGMYLLYEAPFEIIVAGFFLYHLLGWSAFVGLLVLLLGWPVNKIITGSAIRIQKKVLAARDKRTTVVNELIGAIKFIKFYAWEDLWIQRALDARKNELNWMIKERINSIMFQILWWIAPFLISILSFFVFVMQGNELTIGTAFTALTLFNMIRQPLDTLPSWALQFLRTVVGVRRIEAFLGEDEVDEKVSTLKRSEVGPRSSTISEFGIRSASFVWNSSENEQKERSKGSDGKNAAIERPRDHEHDADNDSTSDCLNSMAIQKFRLQDISVVFPEGQLTIITGPTASGKTAFLLSLLGEMSLLPGGEVFMSKQPDVADGNGLMHSISYAAQAPWLQHQSIRENILFGSPYNETLYNEVIECCALLPDLEILEDADETEVGEGGISLSGGQKARVALARAVYARSKYVLLDDPLSAVDSHTARFLYERLFLGPLLRNRTVVLVTHHVKLVLPGAHYVVRMLDGRIDVQGAVKDLQESGALEQIALEAKIEEQEEERDVKGTEEFGKKEEEILDGAIPAESPNIARKTKPRKLVEEEERQTGAVKWYIYKTYLKASSYWTWFVIILFGISDQFLGFAEKYWIKVWGEAYESSMSILSVNVNPGTQSFEGQALLRTHVLTHYRGQHQPSTTTADLVNKLPSAQSHPLFYVGTYALIGLLAVIVAIGSSVTTYVGSYLASRVLFKDLLITAVRATMRWHDTTPTGRTLNRFSKDMDTIDGSLMQSLQAVNLSLATFVASVIIVISVFPPFFIPAFFIGCIYYHLAVGYLNSGRDLRRMESNSRSPLFSGFKELLDGIVTVRAFSAEPRFLNSLYKKVDLMLKLYYSIWMTSRWLLFRFESIGALSVFLTTMFALASVSSNSGRSAGWAALCITSAMAFTNSVYWACRFWTKLELDLNSVERVVEYLDLPQEPPPVIESSRPPAHWPSTTGPNSEALISVQDLEVRYAPDLPTVIHGISFSLRARERVGILGRTGSGKSTLAMSILRFVDPYKGKILIDGVDITSVGVYDLRSRLTFIPQDATLFSGTIRDNLDPFDEYSDGECLDALKRVHLIADMSRMSPNASAEPSRAPTIYDIEREETDATIAVPQTATSSKAPSEFTLSATSGSTKLNHESGGRGPVKITLETEVSAGGQNFSAGQKQLIAMARALLRQSAIIVLDEATSSIDFSTDAKIQRTIREEFSSSLLLTVAHRLRTVIDYDRLIVLDAGRIAELDTPYNLIHKEGGIFRTMCLKSGSFAELLEVAKAKAQQDEVMMM